MSLAITGAAQGLVIPQVADGGNWRTAIVLTNVTSNPATATLTFFQESTNGMTVPWNPPFLETSNTENMPIAAGAMLYLHTAGTSAVSSRGWAQLTGDGIKAYAIYTYAGYAGRPDQDGTSEAVAPASRILVPFDSTPGFVTSLAIANPNPSNLAISVNVWTDANAVAKVTLPAIPPNGHTAFDIADQIPAASGHRGVAEFWVASGGFAISAFRFNPTVALTSSPVLPQTGVPIISGSPTGGTTGGGGGGGTTGGGGTGGGTGGTGGGTGGTGGGTGGTGGTGGGGTPTFFSHITITASPSPLLPPLGLGLPSPPELGISSIVLGSPNSSGTYAVATILGVGGLGTAIPLLTGYNAVWASATLSGQTITFNGLVSAQSNMQNTVLGLLHISPITSATLTVTLNPGGTSTSGTVTGNLNLVSTLGTVSGSFTGTYAAQ